MKDPVTKSMQKPLTHSEVENLAYELQPLIGSQLQEALSSEQTLALGFYHNQQRVWLVIDLLPSSPGAFLSPKEPALKNKKTTPVLLFLRAHFFGLRLVEATAPEQRVLALKFRDKSLEIRLFPHGQNIIAHTSEKSISWNKPRALKASIAPEKTVTTSENQHTVRSSVDIMAEWELSQKPKTQTLEHILHKKQKAYQELEAALQKNLASKWQSFAEWLKSNQKSFGEEIPLEWREFVDPHINYQENLEIAFETAKKRHQKEQGARDRLAALQEEINKLKNGEAPKSQEKLETKHAAIPEDFSGKRFLIEDQYPLFVGKSAKDNLGILRRAGPQDLWFHLKDYPGAHGILRVPRGKALPEAAIQAAAQKFISVSAAAKHHIKDGDRVDVLICECRFVRPIKGDKLGRVQYHSERVITIKIEL